MAKKTEREKLERTKEPYFDNVEPSRNMKISGKMVIPAGSEYEKLMKSVPKGKLLTQDVMREYFAKKYQADFCCPLVTGIMVGLVARASIEDVELRGLKPIEMTPYWRTVKTGGLLNDKYPGGVERHAELLKGEGFDIVIGRNGRPKGVVIDNQSEYLLT